MVAKRNQDNAAVGRVRDHNLHIRITRQASKELASLQGLCQAYGNDETLGELFEFVCLPAIAEHCKVYAQRAVEKTREVKV